jgi:Lysyl oxidase
VAEATTVTNAMQEILDADGNVVHEQIVSTFEFHPAHNHWHIGDVALFEVRPARDDGTRGRWGVPLVNDRGQSQSIKTTFCLIDWYKLDDNSPTAERTYFDCYTSYQGISPGWVDQYHQAKEGQQIDMTGAPVGVYYLVSTANPAGNFLETDTTNNTAWTSFRLTRDSKGNPKIAVISHSPCDSPGMCGQQATNR